MQEQKSRTGLAQLLATTNLITGGAAGIMEACICHPLDTVKVGMQLANKEPMSPLPDSRNWLVSGAVGPMCNAPIDTIKTRMQNTAKETYISRLGRLGYCWQFITLAGLHSIALMTDGFAREFVTRGMRAYGEIIQEPEIGTGCEVVLHQKWRGANYIDEILKMVSGGITSTAAMGKGVTETQFA